MKEQAEKLEKAIIASQELARKLAEVPPLHGLKKVHKEFWTEIYPQIQQASIDLIKTAELYYQQRNLIDLPFTDEKFRIAWSDYVLYYLQETGYFLGEVRERIQLKTLAAIAKDSDEAVRMLEYFMNKGNTFIYKVNFEQKNAEQPKPVTTLSDEDYR